MKIKGFFTALLLAAMSASASAQTATLPDLNADDYIEGQAGGTFGAKVAKIAPRSNRVAIAGFRVIFVTTNAIKAQVRASYLPGRDQTAAHASMEVELQGTDVASMQAITDKAYATFVEQLKAAGREVVPQEQLAAFFADVKRAEGAPYTKVHKLGYGKRTGLGFAPTGMPLWFHYADGAWGDTGFDQSNYKKAGALSKEVNAFVIAPLIVVDFAQMQSSGNRSGLVAREAKVGAELTMSVPAREMGTILLRAEEIKFGGISKGDAASMTLVKGLESDLAFADMEVVEEKKTTGFMAIMTGSSKSKSANAAKTDAARYSAAATEVLGKATGTLAKFFQQHPASAAPAAE